MADSSTKGAKSGGVKMSTPKGGRAKGGRAAKFDQNLADLEALVEQLESGDLGLEDALKLFEKGVKLTRNCQQALDNAQQKVETLIVESGITFSESEEDAEDEDYLGDDELEDEDIDE